MIAHPRVAAARPLEAARLAAGNRLALASVVALSAVVRAAVALGHLTPTYFPDEYIYASLGRSLGATGRPLIRGGTAHFPALLEPLLAAPLWAFASLDTAYRLVQVENAVLMSLAALPVFGLARRLGLGDRYALACATFSVLTPGLVYTNSVLADPVGYPLALAALYFGLVALQQPGARSQIGFLAFAGLATFARVQYVILLAAFVIAALAVDRRHALRAQKLVFAVLGTGALGVAAVGIGRAAGYYSAIGSDRVGRSLFTWFGVELLLLTITSGVALVPGAAIGFACARGRREVAFAALVAAYALALLVEGALYSSNGSNQFKGRYLISLGPLLPLAFGLYLRRGRPARLAAAGLAAAIAVTVAAVPLSGYAAAGGYTDSPLLWCLEALQWRLGVGGASLLVALVSTAGAALAAALAWKRVPGAVVFSCTAAAVAALSVGSSIFSTHSSRTVRNTLLAPDPSWIDDAGLGSVTAVQTPGAARGPLTEQLVWNRSLDREVLLGGATATDAFEAPPLTIGRTGELIVGGHPLTTSVLFEEFMATPVLTGAKRVGSFGQLALYRLAGVPRLRLLEVGRYWDGWLGLSGTLRAWPSGPGAVEFSLSLPASHSGAVVVRFGKNRFTIRPGGTAHVHLTVRRGGPWATTFALVSGATALPDGRPVAVRATAPALTTP